MVAKAVLPEELTRGRIVEGVLSEIFGAGAEAQEERVLEGSGFVHETLTVVLPERRRDEGSG